MSNIWNPHAFGVTGQPVGPQVNTLRVYGAEPTKDQLAMAQQTFAKFCMTDRLSFAPNQTQQGFLPDGSKYRIVVVGNTRIMEVRVDGVDSESSQSGVLVTTWQSGSQYTRTLFVPGGDFAMPNGKWKAISRKRQYAGDQSLYQTRPHYIGESWHSPDDDEYYVEENSGVMERAGYSVLDMTHTVPGPGTLFSPVMALEINGIKRFCQLYRTGTAAYMIHGPSVDTDGYETTQSVTLSESMEIIEAPPQTYVLAVNPSPAGTSALVTFRKYNSLAPTGTPLPCDRQRAWWPYRRGDSLTVYELSVETLAVNKDDIYASEYSFDGIEWNGVGEFYRAEFGECSPQSNYLTNIYDNIIYQSGGITRTIVAWPEWVVNPLLGASCTPPSGGVTDVPDSLARSLAGTVSGTESQSFDSGEVLESGNPYSSAWYAHDSTKHAMPVRTIHEYDMSFTSTVDYKVYETLRCSFWDTPPVWTVLDSGEHGTRSEVGSASCSLYHKEFVTIGSNEFILKELTASEAIDYTISISSDSTEVTDFYNSEIELDTVLDVEYLGRRLLEVDPQFGMVCFVEAEYSFQRTAGSVFASVQVLSTDEKTSTYTGGDTDPPPTPPQGYVVIEINGAEVYREEFPSARDDETPAIFTDCTHPWVYFNGRSVFASPADMFMNMESLYGTTINASSPFFYSLGTAESPTTAAGGGAVVSDYAKDPKTGGGVLIIRSAPDFVRGFVVDHDGVKPIAQIAPSVALSQSSTVAAT